MRLMLLVVAGLTVSMAGRGMAQTPSSVNFQGRMTDAQGNVITGSKSITFSIWSAASGGSQLWSETQSVGVSSGVYNAALGSGVSLSTGVFASSGTWLQLQVSPDAAMTPRLAFQSVPYAMKAAVADYTFNPDWPDGTSNLVPVQTAVSAAGYTVPAGYNLNLVVMLPQAPCSDNCDLTANGVVIAGLNLTHFALDTPTHPIILPPGTVVASTSSAITIGLSGFLSPTRVTAIATSVAASGGTYTVPNGVTLYLRGVGFSSLCGYTTPGLTMAGIDFGTTGPVGLIGPGQTITNNLTCAVTLEGFLH